MGFKIVTNEPTVVLDVRLEVNKMYTFGEDKKTPRQFLETEVRNQQLRST